MNKVIKMMNKNKMILIIVVALYVLSKVERREGFDPFKAKSWKKVGKDATSLGKKALKKAKISKNTKYEKKLKKQLKECEDNYDRLMNAYTGYMKKNPTKRTQKRF